MDNIIMLNLDSVQEKLTTEDNQYYIEFCYADNRVYKMDDIRLKDNLPENTVAIEGDIPELLANLIGTTSSYIVNKKTGEKTEILGVDDTHADFVLFDQEHTSVNEGATPKTKLDRTMFVYYADNLRLGSGVDVITQRTAPRAVTPFTLHKEGTKESKETFTIVADSEDYSKLTSSNVGANAIVKGISLGASAENSKHIKYSTNMMTAVFQYSETTTPVSMATDYQMDTKAAEYMSTFPEDFRNKYGDYFVAGYKYGSEMNVYFNFYSESSSTMDSFKSKAKAGYGKNNLSAGVSLCDLAGSMTISYSYHVEMKGYSGTYQGSDYTKTQKELHGLFDWFKNNTSNVPVIAALNHYSLVNPQYSQYIDIEPQKFADMRSITSRYQNVMSMYNTLPLNYQKLCSSQINDYKQLMDAWQNTLLTDDKARSDCFAKTKEMEKLLGDISARHAFYLVVKIAAQSEPVQGREMKTTGDALYGVTSYPHSAVSISSHDGNVQKGSSFMKHVKDTFVFNDPQKLIVAFNVSDRWKDGSNGTWKKENTQIISKSSASISFKSQYSRGMHFRIKIYYVDRKDYPDA